MPWGQRRKFELPPYWGHCAGMPCRDAITQATPLLKIKVEREGEGVEEERGRDVEREQLMGGSIDTRTPCTGTIDGATCRRVGHACHPL